ncbi:hypothetical protein [Massilia pseudoviolaceinigra]|uniref:hypothetical protein n=1 Tax=Massilia pseudoviolaceinigra TaxID=3057165 RepID=UPI002796B4D8|nr:hypothetical protein [Massilia sp. CCM 9206]MDQ1919264.1 hypothetical protein [Massilia sp. CCM 9206]
MGAAATFQQLFRGALSRQVEYSYSDDEHRFSSMIPLTGSQLNDLDVLAGEIPYAGDWAWSVRRFAQAVRPDAFLLRLDWHGNAASAVTLYCRFPGEPDEAAFRSALAHARPFEWNGPGPDDVARALGVNGPRGIAFRSSDKGMNNTALYFKSGEHAGRALGERMPALLAACGYPAGLQSLLEKDLHALYRPGPVGVIGVDDGQEGQARALKFDPANVALDIAFDFLARARVPAERIDTLRRTARDLRADAASYLSAQYGPDGLRGWRIYFACEPCCTSVPARPVIDTQRNLRELRRLPHY